MAEVMLIDTSAWIESFRGNLPETAQQFIRQAIEADQVATTPLVVFELLQGVRNPRQWRDLKEQLESLQQFELSASAWDRAYGLGFRLRRNGLTIPTVDTLIAALALERDCLLVHHDRHFERMVSVTGLRTLAWLPNES